VQHDVTLGSIAYHLGDRRPIDELDFLRADPRRLELYKLAGFEAYCASELSMRELAARSARQTLERSGLRPEDIGACLYVAESYDRDEVVSSPEVNRLLVDLGLTRAVPIHVSIANCANILAALRIARALVASGDAQHVLVMSVDKAARRASGRRMFQDMSIKSDISVSCVVSRGGTGTFDLLHVAQHNLAGLIDVIDSPAFATEKFKELRRAAKQAREHLGLTAADFTRIIINNYGREVMRMFVELCGFPKQAGWYRNLGRFAHAVAGDVLINLADADANGEIAAGDRVFLMADSITSSSIACVRRRSR
jgi:3-oxoacyl-[acyl-carrier-protein] synthase-3